MENNFDEKNLINKMAKSITQLKNNNVNLLHYQPSDNSLTIDAVLKPLNYEANKDNSNKDEKPKDFVGIAKKQIETYISKNADYGSATQKLFDEYGIDYYLIMIEQKLLRIKSIIKNNMANNESIEDSFLDLANYAMLAVESLRKNI